jgi:chloramphenicol 3-O phosphotransferase
MSRIIVLNGCSSAGKTSISKAIQALSKTPWLHIGIDTFIGMLPSRFLESGDLAAEGYYSFVHSENERGACIHVKTEPRGGVFFHEHVPKVVQLLADLGHDMIVDEVIFDAQSMEKILQKLRAHTVFLVQVTCDIDVLLERERLRGDRVIGLANDQFDRLQSYSYDYDLTVDTTTVPAIENARRILGNQG